MNADGRIHYKHAQALGIYSITIHQLNSKKNTRISLSVVDKHNTTPKGLHVLLQGAGKIPNYEHQESIESSM